MPTGCPGWHRLLQRLKQNVFAQDTFPQGGRGVGVGKRSNSYVLWCLSPKAAPCLECCMAGVLRMEASAAKRCRLRRPSVSREFPRESGQEKGWSSSPLAALQNQTRLAAVALPFVPNAKRGHCCSRGRREGLASHGEVTPEICYDHRSGAGRKMVALSRKPKPNSPPWTLHLHSPHPK